MTHCYMKQQHSLDHRNWNDTKPIDCKLIFFCFQSVMKFVNVLLIYHGPQNSGATTELLQYRLIGKVSNVYFSDDVKNFYNRR